MRSVPKLMIGGNKKIKVERTWIYKSILGDVLGLYTLEKETELRREVHLDIQLQPDDILYINEKEISL